MNYTIYAYSIYLPVAIMLTIWVANKLLTNAKVFYVDIFHGQDEQALSLNKLIQVGFYLLAFGLAFLLLEFRPEITLQKDGGAVIRYMDTIQGLMEALSVKIGGFVVILGIMLFVNLVLILTQRNNAAKMLAQAIAKNKITETK